MFYSLRGTVVAIQSTFAVVECGGVGYKCLTSLHTLSNLPGVGKEATLYTHLHVREDAIELFGFAAEEEVACFRMLTSVSGVGPKVALAILSLLSPDRVALAIVGGDAKSLTQAAGVGQKLAQRIVLELKDKLKGAAFGYEDTGAVAAVVNSTAHSAMAEAVSALVVLGYSQSEATAALAKADPALPVEELIRMGLKGLAGAR